MRRKRKEKGKKDPNKPKRNQSGYFHWLNANRENIKADNPGISITEISKVAGQRWNELKDKTVSVHAYHVLYAASKLTLP